jgi:hypothetical protein
MKLFIDDESNTYYTYIKDTLEFATNTRGGISSLKKNALISSF